MKATAPPLLLVLVVAVLASAAPLGRAAADAGAESGAKHAKNGGNGFLQPAKENKAWKYYEPAVLFGLLAAVCAAAVVAPAVAKSHGGGKGSAFDVPVADSKGWLEYKFDFGMNSEQTSFRPAPLPAAQDDPYAPGSLGTIVAKLYAAGGDQEQIGVGTLARTVVSNVDGLMTRQLQAVFNFGSEEDGFTEGSISVTAQSSRVVPDSTEFVSWDGHVTGGRGVFLGATGAMSVLSNDVTFDDFLAVTALHRLEIFVPRDLPGQHKKP